MDARCEPLERRALLSAPGAFASRGPGGGGAFFAPSFSPHTSGEMFVTSDMSGVYRSSNFGASWTIQDFREIQGKRESQVQYTSSPSILYSVDHSELSDGSTRNVPTKSTDNGATWTPMSWPSDVTYSLYADPASTTRVIASDYDHIYISTNGSTFTSKYTGPSGTGLHVGGAFFDGNNIYVGTNVGLLRSTDGGVNFAVATIAGIPAGQAIYSLAGAKAGAITRLVCVTMPDADLYAGVLTEDVAHSWQGIYSLDVGGSWVSRSAGVPAADHPTIVSMARTDINTVYVAGASTNDAPSVIKSTNGGASWSDVLVTANNGNVATGWQGAGGDRQWSFGELAMAFQVSPTNANNLAFTDFGYVHVSTDGGAMWRQAYVNPADQNPAGASTPNHKAYHGVGLEDTSALWLTWTSSSNVVAGYTDIYGARSTDGGSSWLFPTFNSAQNTIYQISKAASGTLYGASSSVHDLYQSTYLTDARVDGTNTGRIVYSTDAGNIWNTLHDFGDPVIYTAIDPNNPNRMYASVVHSINGGIFVTNNLNLGTSSTWTKLTNPPRTQGHPYNINVLNDGKVVVSYSGRRTSAFTNSSGVFMYTPDVTVVAGTWDDRTDAGMIYYTKDITIDPNDASQNTWYAAVRSGWSGTGNGTGGLYKTTNRGVNWTRIFSADSAESLTIVPGTGEMYLATLSSGIYYSTGGASPTFTQLNYPFRQVSRIFLNPYDSTQVWAASFGYGLAVAQADSTPPAVASAVLTTNTSPKKLDFTFTEDISASLGVPDLQLTNLSTSTTVNASSVTTGANSGSFLFSGGLPSGRYQAKLLAAGVRDAAQNPMSADYIFNFIFVDNSQTLSIPSTNSIFVINQLSIGTNATLNLNDNDLIIDYAANTTSPYAQTLASMQSGYNGGFWNGVGLTSALAAANEGATGLGLAEAAEMFNLSGSATDVWNGITVDATAVLVKYTWSSDANLDGFVNNDDFGQFLYGFNGGGAARWLNGDFDLNGFVDNDDFGWFLTGMSAFNASGGVQL